METFKEELTRLINKYNKENYSNTPDFILANHLENCLLSFESAILERDKWYNFDPININKGDN